MGFYEEACAARFAAQEPLSVGWLARTSASSANYNDWSVAREALEAFGAKRGAEAEMMHVVSGFNSMASSFSSGETPRVEISLVSAAEVAEEKCGKDAASSETYCVAPKDGAQLWFVDAERSKVLMGDSGEAGEAFRENRGGKIRQEGLKVAEAKDWTGGGSIVKAKQKPVVAKKKTLSSFFTAGSSTTDKKKKEQDDKKKVAAKVPPKPVVAEDTKKRKALAAPPEEKKKQQTIAAAKPRRRIVDDDDDDDEAPASAGKKRPQPDDEEEDDDDEKPAAATVAKAPAGPRLVEKTSMDEKGYLVTHKVWENVSAAPSAAAAAAPRPPPPKTKKNLPKPKPKKPKPQPKGQTDMFSFFKKK